MIFAPGFWHSPNFTVPPPQWSTWEPTKLEALALRAGVAADELREILYCEIERRRGELQTDCKPTVRNPADTPNTIPLS